MESCTEDYSICLSGKNRGVFWGGLLYMHCSLYIALVHGTHTHTLETVDHFDSGGGSNTSRKEWWWWSTLQFHSFTTVVKTKLESYSKGKGSRLNSSFLTIVPSLLHFTRFGETCVLSLYCTISCYKKGKHIFSLLPTRLNQLSAKKIAKKRVSLQLLSVPSRFSFSLHSSQLR